MHTELLNQSFNNHKTVLWLLCDIWLVCFGSVLISFCVLNLCLCRSENSGTMTRRAHTGNMCRLTVRQGDRQTEGPARLGGPDVPMQTQRWDVCHPGPVFARLSIESPAGCLAPWASVFWGKNWGQRDSHIYTGDEGGTTNILCVARGQRSTSHTTLSSGGRSLLFFRLLCRCERDLFGLAGGQTECQSCHGGGWPYQASIDTGWRWGQLLLNMYTAAFGIDI